MSADDSNPYSAPSALGSGRPVGAEEAAPPFWSGWCRDGSPLGSPGGLELVARGFALACVEPGARVVDLGCGSGETAAFLRRSLNLRAIGVDTAERIGSCAGIQGSFVRADARRLPFARGAVDAVLLECALSAMRDPQSVLAECSRVLAARGRLVIADLYARDSGPASDRQGALPCGSRILTRAVLASMLAANRLRILAWEEHTPALKQFLFQFIMKHGPLERLWMPEREPGDGPGSDGLRKLRAGYFLAIAAREMGSI